MMTKDEIRDCAILTGAIFNELEYIYWVKHKGDTSEIDEYYTHLINERQTTSGAIAYVDRIIDQLNLSEAADNEVITSCIDVMKRISEDYPDEEWGTAAWKAGFGIYQNRVNEVIAKYNV